MKVRKQMVSMCSQCALFQTRGKKLLTEFLSKDYSLSNVGGKIQHRSNMPRHSKTSRRSKEQRKRVQGRRFAAESGDLDEVLFLIV